MAEYRFSVDDLQRVKRMVEMAGLVKSFDREFGWVDLRSVMSAVIDQTVTLMSERDKDPSGD